MVVEVDQLGEAKAVAPANASYHPTDPQVAFHLASFIEHMRGLPKARSSFAKTGWEANDFTTDGDAIERLDDISFHKDGTALGGVESKDSHLSANQIQGFFLGGSLGVMDRLVSSDATWERMAPLINRPA
ncbi:hypothetical protein ABIA45_007430 [Bradyrhizobium sp. USDA 336]